MHDRPPVVAVCEHAALANIAPDDLAVSGGYL